jgi:ankyrin repeat protein
MSNLLTLCRNGSIASVRQLIADNYDVNVEVNGVSPLSVAIESDNPTLTSLLLEAGAELTARAVVDAACRGQRALVAVLIDKFKPQGGGSILHMLSWSTEPDHHPLHKAAVDLIIKEGAALANGVDSDHQTPLQRAVEVGNAYVVAALVRARADVNVVSKKKRRSALMIAAENGDLAVVRALLGAGPALQVDATTIDGNTALHKAIHACTPSLPVVMALLEARADANVANKKGKTPLFYASSGAIARALLDARADVNHRGNGGRTPLAMACAGGLVEVVKVFLARGANVDITSGSSWTPLMFAAHKDHLAVVQLLLLARSPTLLNARAGDRATALFIAVRNNFIRIVNALLAAGADPNIAKRTGFTPLMVALDARMAQRLIDRGADVNAQSDAGDTALTRAASDENKDAALVELLLAQGADVTASDHDGWSALMWAASQDRVDKMQPLLQAPGAPAGSVNARSQDGATALILASRTGATAAVEALIAAGADVNLADDAGNTAIHVADNTDIARLLRNAGAEVNQIYDHVPVVLSIDVGAPVPVRAGENRTGRHTESEDGSVRDEPTAKRRRLER